MIKSFSIVTLLPVPLSSLLELYTPLRKLGRRSRVRSMKGGDSKLDSRRW